MITDLLREKYDREFEVVHETRGYTRSNRWPEAYCIEKGIEDLVFTAVFDYERREIVREEYVYRKLGRQLEDIIIKCFASHDVEAAANAQVSTFHLEPAPHPDITLDRLLIDYRDGEILFHTDIVIPSTVESPRSSELVGAAVLDIGAVLQRFIGMLIHVVPDDEFEVFREHTRRAPMYDCELHPQWNDSDTFLAFATETGLEISDPYFPDYYKRWW